MFRRRAINWTLDLREGIDFAIYLLGAFEGSTQRVYRRIISPGDIVFDIGANIGSHTLPLAQCVGSSGHVHAFEATVYACSKLRANLELNPLLARRVSLIHCLLNDAKSEFPPDKIYSRWPLDSKMTKTHPQHGGLLESIGPAQYLSIDEYVATLGGTRIDFIKLDVDGHEFSVLRGGQDTLNEQSPPILMEFAPTYQGVQPSELLDFLWSHGYSLFPLKSPKPFPEDPPGIIRSIPHNGSINILALPKARKGQKSNASK